MAGKSGNPDIKSSYLCTNSVLPAGGLDPSTGTFTTSSVLWLMHNSTAIISAVVSAMRFIVASNALSHNGDHAN